MRHISGDKLRSIKHTVSHFLTRIGSGWRSVVLVGGCAALFLAAGKLNFAYAVNMDGDLLGYVSSKEELDCIVEDVQQSVSQVLGYDWIMPALTCRMTLSTVSDTEEQLADRILNTVDALQELAVIYVDGEAVCAFETREDALNALKNLYRSYQNENTESACFLQDVTVDTARADKQLLDNSIRTLDSMLDVETVDIVVTEEPIYFRTVRVEDPELYVDESYVRTEGVDGYECTTCRITRVNGVITNSETIDSQRTPCINQVYVAGTKERKSTGTYIWPCDTGYLSSYFGSRNIELGSSYHQGIDIAADANTPIHAADGGTVIFAEEYGSYGNLLKIQHDNGDITYYAHCSSFLVEVGQFVEQGQEIALVGSTGVSTGNHLHFELHPDGGDAVNPISYLQGDRLPYLDC